MTATYLLERGAFVIGKGLPLTDRGFRYGMSVFETIACRNSTPLLLDPHLEKLTAAVTATGFTPPAGWLEAIRAALLPPPIPEGVARVYVTAGDHDGDASRVALLFEPLPVPVTLSSARAVTVDFTAPTPFGKTGNYWPHILARPPSGDEAILRGPGGALLGGAMANLFLVCDGALLTPRDPVRRGVVHDWIRAKFSVTAAVLTRADLATADAVFLTNSRHGVCNLDAIDGRELPGDGRVKSVWRRYATEVLRAA